MPPSSSENDLKRRARRRLIGAVALTLLAVIVLPLLLEDEPPPASSLAVKMAASPTPVQADTPAVAPAASPQARVTEPAVLETTLPEPAPRPEPPELQLPPPAPKPEPAKPAPKPVARPATTPPQQAKPATADEMYVVQLAALSDSAKAHALKGRAALAGFPAYTDKIGTLTRVRVGPYKSREAAVAASVKLAENGMAGQILTK
jgi:DedD protein